MTTRIFSVALFLAVVSVAAADNFDAGIAAYERGDYAIALQVFRPLAEEGDAEAQYNLGVMYNRGEGIPQDFTKAVALYRKVAVQGHVGAQSNLGKMYAEGKWFRKAAEQGKVFAQNNSGQLYIKGESVPQNFGEAIT